MKTLNEKFTDEEFKEMETVKNNHNMNWHDMVLWAIRAYDEE